MLFRALQNTFKDQMSPQYIYFENVSKHEGQIMSKDTILVCIEAKNRAKYDEVQNENPYSYSYCTK